MRAVAPMQLDDEDFLNLSTADFIDRIAIGRAGEEELASLLVAAGISVLPVAPAMEDAHHPRLSLPGGASLPVPDFMAFVPGVGPCWIEAKVKRTGTYPGKDAYGMEFYRWSQLVELDNTDTGLVFVAFYSPQLGWKIGSIQKLKRLVRRHGQWVLFPLDTLTPLDDLLEGVALGPVVKGRAV